MPNPKILLLALELLLVQLFYEHVMVVTCESSEAIIKLYNGYLQSYSERFPPKSLSTETHATYIHPSLFPSVAPYIQFAAFNVADRGFEIPEEIHTELIWRKSSEIKRGGFQTHYFVNQTGVSILDKGKNDKDWFGYWHGLNVIRQPALKETSASYQKINYFLGAKQLGQKDLQNLNIQRFINKFGQEDFPFVFQNFILPEEFAKFQKAWHQHKNKLWIIKPHLGYGSIGVRVIDDWREVETNKGRMTVQKYLNEPFLFHGRKFEIRMFVLVTSFNPLRAYLYNEGSTKVGYRNFTADPKFKSDPCIHTRVDNPETECPGAVKDDFLNDGFWTHKTGILKELKKDGQNVDSLQNDMEDAIIKTLLSVDRLMDTSARDNHLNRYNQFQIFALDFLVDKGFNPWLIEVNSTPGFSISTDDDVELKFNLVQKVLNLVGHHFPPTLSKTAIKELLGILSSKFAGNPTFDERLYTFELSLEDKNKQAVFANWRYNSSECEEKSSNILKDLSPDDVKQLVIAEDELSRAEFGPVHSFTRIFPKVGMQKYLKYVQSHPYYYLLLSAWEQMFGSNRKAGIKRLRELLEVLRI